MGFFGGQTKQEAMSGPGFEEETFEDAFDSLPPLPKPQDLLPLHQPSSAGNSNSTLSVLISEGCTS